MYKIIPLFALSAISMSALADVDDTQHFYGSVGGGAYRLDSQGFKDVAPSTKLLGGYSFNRNVAVEASYSRLFESSDSVDTAKVRIDGNVWDLGAKLSYPTGSRFSPYGRLGWSYADLSATMNDTGTRTHLNEYQDVFSWAAGATFNLDKQFALNGEYAKTMVNDANLDSFSVNLSYRFGTH